MKYRWTQHSIKAESNIPALSVALNHLPEPLVRALIARGIDDLEKAKDFFRGSLDQLHDPFLMHEMQAAAERLAHAAAQQECVMVYGDYDVDGTTATAMMTDYLRSIGCTAHYFIPDRMVDGYGLGSRGLDEAKSRGCSLVVALDCGITALEAGDYAAEIGLDLIICDHHTALETRPTALAVLDPKQAACTYPFDELCGCGVGFKLIQATNALLDRPIYDAWKYLDLVALATTSDIVPLQDENRILLREGLKRLSQGDRPGIRALADRAGVTLRAVSVRDIGFGMGPRINAAGRMKQATLAVDLLLEEDPDKALKLADRLEQANVERQGKDRAAAADAVTRVERMITASETHGLVVYGEDWHPGIIGIVASRVVERFYRPCAVLCSVQGEIKGSVRSIEGINIYDALEHCKEHLIQFGGHMYAAGLTMREEHIAAFRAAFNEAVGRQITAEVLTPVLTYDAEVTASELTDRFWAVLKQFGPHGPENAEPIFRLREVTLNSMPKPMGKTGDHLRLELTTGLDAHMKAVGFRLGKALPMVQEAFTQQWPLDLLVSLSENTWRGRTTLEMRIHDIQRSDADAKGAR